MTTLVDVFRLLERQRGEFVIHDDGYRVRRFSYPQVTRAARGFAARLAAAGVGRGDKVLVWGENSAEWLACYWGAVISGVIVVPIDYRSSEAFAHKVAGIVQASAVLVGREVGEEGPDRQDLEAGKNRRDLEPAKERRDFETAKNRRDFETAKERRDFSPGVSLFSPGVPLWRFHDFDWIADGPMPSIDIGRDDIAQIVFTSGATAEPKGVVVRHKNLLANLVPVAHEVAKYKKYATPFLPVRFLNLLPLSHLFGQSMATNIPPLVNGTVVFMHSFNPHDIVDRVREWRVSIVVCVPKMLDVLRDHAVRLDPTVAAPPPGLSIAARWWRYRGVHRAFGLKFWGFVVGAAPLGAELEDYWKRLGFVVIQGYGLTETAPIVTLNHPFKTSTGSVGTPVAGVEIKVAGDGEILVRGDNVTEGYYAAEGEEAGGPPAPGSTGPDLRRTPELRTRDAEGWLHTGDIGELDAQGRLFIRGRKKEMIVTPEGLNVFPDDVERELEAVPGVVESAVVGHHEAGRADERVHAVLVLEPGVDSDEVIARANAGLLDHQRIRSFSVWLAGPLPRTEGTRKLKRSAIRKWVDAGAVPLAPQAGDGLESLLARFAGGRPVGGDTSLEALGLSSLERVELMVALEDRFQTRIDETKFAEARTLDELKTLVEQAPSELLVEEPVSFPRWNRRPLVRWIRRLSLATWILPLARVFAWVGVSGLEHLERLEGPVVFAANHQSHMDVPVILAALPGRWRARVAPAMAKEFFKAHFHPAQFTTREVITNRLNYYLAAFFFGAFPLPQREAGARQTLRYIGEVTGDGFSVLIFPEGGRSDTGDIKAFRGGIGMIGSRLEVPVVPVRLDEVDKVLHPSWKMARPGRCFVTFGAPLRLEGDDYAGLARQVEEAVRRLHAAPHA
ncbi:MAG: AMP-binding protein [Acidobacteria bacterium]|nr:AMP-binding protein [Acidobacteriota bacterium]